jgi:hypothetical protein
VGSRVERALLVPEFVNRHNLFPIRSLLVRTVANPIWTSHGRGDRESEAPSGSTLPILSPLNLHASRLIDIRRIRVRGLLANQVNHANTLLKVDADAVGRPQHIGFQDLVTTSTLHSGSRLRSLLSLRFSLVSNSKYSAAAPLWYCMSGKPLLHVLHFRCVLGCLCWGSTIVHQSAFFHDWSRSAVKATLAPDAFLRCVLSM